MSGLTAKAGSSRGLSVQARLLTDAVLQHCTYDAGNKLTAETVDGITYSYDENGNLTEKTVGAGTPVDYTWNHEDKLTAVDDATDLTMKTDADGFRRSKTVGAVVTKFLYDLGQIQTPGLAPVMAEYNGSGVLQAKYHSGAAGLLAMKRTGSTIRWYLCDAVGSVRKLAESNGGITDNYLMDAWGNLIIGGSSGTTVNPFRYAGRENYYSDPTDLPDLMLLGLRYYNPALGRFITPDPIGLAGGDYNLYRYVKDGPIDLMDPSGRTASNYQLVPILNVPPPRGTVLPIDMNWKSPVKHGSVKLSKERLAYYKRRRAEEIVAWKSATLGFPHAAEAMLQYLGNSGKQAWLDVQGLIQSVAAAKTTFLQDYNDAEIFAKSKVPGLKVGKKYNFQAIIAGHYIVRPSESIDWNATLQGYDAWGSGYIEKWCGLFGIKGVTLNFRWNVWDPYTWTGLYGPDDPGYFHVIGLAQEFLQYGYFALEGPL